MSSLDDDNAEKATAGVADLLEEEEDEVEVKQLNSKETKKVWVWKFLVILVIIGTATLVSVGTYIMLDQSEDENYEDGYDQMVNTIKDASEFHADNILTALRTFSAEITSGCDALSETFPFCSLPNFEAIASGVRTASGAEMINWHVRVEQDQLEEWSLYSRSNFQPHQEQQRAIALTLNKGSTYNSVKNSDFVDGDITPYPYIPQFTPEGLILPGELQLAPSYGEGPYWPAWMVSPPVFTPAFINSDPYPWVLNKPITAGLLRRAIVFTRVIPVSNLAGRSIKFEDHEAYHQSLVDYVQDPEGSAFDHPHPGVIVPVFDKLNDPTSRIVGMFMVIFPWDRFLINLLPEGVSGITCVLRSSCGKAFTYLLDGNSAFYVGEGDFHEPKYSYTEVAIPFGDYLKDPNYEPVDGECTYSYYIYSTQKFENQYRSNLPWTLTLVVASTFAIMIVTFLIYDTFVAQRNQRVVGVATKTNKIVASLYPRQVRQRLMDEASTAFKPENELQSFLDGSRVIQDVLPNSDSPPIADLYPECTVYFADIAGFTAWSSKRQPVEVFTLLEALYKNFDSVTNKRGVFKVETIGDCYVAITGLPQARKDHASAMCKFADDTRTQTRLVTKSLERKLGADTGDLDLRIGLHSGPVTAGVLRGQKSRFQLFGDTVNTAARMESNGMRSKIQVSEATATLLRQGGKEDWLTPRKDLVEAKGKGKMQTYWVEPCRSDVTRTSTTKESLSDTPEQDK